MAKTGSPFSCNSLANSCTCSSIMSYQQKQHLTWNIHGLVNGPLLIWTLCRMGTSTFLGVKRQELGVNHPFPSHDEVKERMELHLYLPSVPSWPVIGWSLHVLFYSSDIRQFSAYTGLGIHFPKTSLSFSEFLLPICNSVSSTTYLHQLHYPMHLLCSYSLTNVRFLSVVIKHKK
jgi:hypothetical protein